MGEATPIARGAQSPDESVNTAQQPAWEFRLSGAVAAWMVPFSIVLFILAAGGYGAVHGSRLGPQMIPTGWSALLGGSAVLVTVIVVHEALHGLGFLVFGGRPSFGAGLAGGMPVAFAFCPGHRFTWTQILVIGGLPLVVIDASALVMGIYAPLALIGAVIIAINSAGAVGDLWMMAIVLQAPRTAKFEDRDGRSITAWMMVGAKTKRPRGLSPRGGRYVMFGVVVLLIAFPLISLLEFALAQSQGGILQIGGVELIKVGRREGHMTARQNAGATLALAVILAGTLVGVGEWLKRRFWAGH